MTAENLTPPNSPDQPSATPQTDAFRSKVNAYREAHPRPDTPEAMTAPREVTPETVAVGATALSGETPAGRARGFLGDRWQAIKTDWKAVMPNKAKWQERTPLSSLKARLPEGAELTKGETAKAVAHEVATAAPLRYAAGLFLANRTANQLNKGPDGATFRKIDHESSGRGAAHALKQTSLYQKWRERSLKVEEHAGTLDNPVTRKVLKQRVAAEQGTGTVTDYLRTLPRPVTRDHGFKIDKAPVALQPRPEAIRARLRTKPSTS